MESEARAARVSIEVGKRMAAQEEPLATLMAERTELLAITMAAQMLNVPDSADATIASAITASSRRMKRLLDNLMEVSRIRAGMGVHLTRGEVNLGELAGRIIEEARLATAGAIEVAMSGDLTARVDEVRFEQVLANLLSNARHHGDPGAPIRLELHGLGDSIEATVHNFGPVIPDAVQHIVTAHGGTIDVDSRPGHGTTFRIRIPRG